MVIGTLGDIVFEVSGETVRTFVEMVHTAAGRWAIHEVMNGKPRAEFLGPGQNEVSLTIRLSSTLGINPREEYEKIGTMVFQGKHAPFMLGTKPIGNGEWYIELNKTTFISVSARGDVNFIEMVATLKEYF